MELDPTAPPAPGLPPLSDGAVAAALAQRLDRPLVLVGMMGVGKSSVGRKLAAALGWPFVDADDAIEAAAQMTIPEIFATFGEAAFRDGERRVIARLLADETQAPAAARHAAGHARTLKVIATGGGAFVNPDTRALILSRAHAIWLDAELETLVERTARNRHRPLLATGDPREILARLRAERAQHYAQAPIHILSGNAPQTRTTARVMAAIHDHLDRTTDRTAAPPETP